MIYQKKGISQSSSKKKNMKVSYVRVFKSCNGSKKKELTSKLQKYVLNKEKSRLGVSKTSRIEEADNLLINPQRHSWDYSFSLKENKALMAMPVNCMGSQH